MGNWLRYPLQGLNYVLFMTLVGYFSFAPPFHHIDAGEAQVTMAFNHAGKTREPCRQLTAEELAKLPPNMRKPTDCPRRRSPVVVELLMDGKLLLESVANPPGLFEDGSVNVFRSVRVPAGMHHFEVRMNDSVRVEGYTHTAEQDANIEEGRLLVVEFNPETGFSFR